MAYEAVIGVDEGIRQFPFGLLQGQNLFLHRIACDQAVSEYAPCLADAVGLPLDYRWNL